MTSLPTRATSAIGAPITGGVMPTTAIRRLLLGLALLTTSTVGVLAETPADATAGDQDGVSAATAVYRTWATRVNVRINTADWRLCWNSPSVANCPSVIGQFNPGDDIYVICQQPGSQVVGGNPNWLLAFGAPTNDRPGWMASYYIAYPHNVLPDVPWCSPA
uniref:Uncharacterized protein n=1 Tax=uncultured bacterium esnapd14 TaxID=1366594 RepID=S5TUT3_9BACT|nr:hypothetical protein [uncultured bacterium esnapd14]